MIVGIGLTEQLQKEIVISSTIFFKKHVAPPLCAEKHAEKWFRRDFKRSLYAPGLTSLQF